MIDVISLGAGKQSSYMLLNALQGNYKYRPDFAIFSDTGCEPTYVYEYLEWLTKYVKEKYEFEIYKVMKGDLVSDIELYINGKTSRVAMIPLRLEAGTCIKTDEETGEEYESITTGGMVQRQCTMDYKIAPLRRYLQKVRNKEDVRLWIGISLDEIERVKDSPVKYIKHYYPLIENRISIDQIVNWFTVNKLPEPGKSACLICPFHSFEYWSMLKRFQPDDFEWACKFDDLIRNYPKLKRKAYLSNQLKPLRDIDFSKHPSLFPDLIEECHGMCGL